MSDKKPPVRIHYEEDYYYTIEKVKISKPITPTNIGKPYYPLYEENIW